MLFGYWLNYFSVFTLKYKNSRKQGQNLDISGSLDMSGGGQGHSSILVPSDRALVYFDSVLLTDCPHPTNLIRPHKRQTLGSALTLNQL